MQLFSFELRKNFSSFLYTNILFEFFLNKQLLFSAAQSWSILMFALFLEDIGYCEIFSIFISWKTLGDNYLE